MEFAHALIPPKFKVVILPARLQDALLISQNGTEIHPAGLLVLLPKEVSVIHGEKIEGDKLCIFSADIHRMRAKVADTFCLPLRGFHPYGGYHIGVVASHYRHVKIPYTFINSDRGIASWITIDKSSDHYFYLAKLTSESWSAGMNQSWEETMPNHLRLYPAGYNVIHTYSLNTHTYPYDPLIAYIAKAADGESKRVDITANAKIDVIEISSDLGHSRSYHLLILPIETVSVNTEKTPTLPKASNWHTYTDCSIKHPIKGSHWTTEHVADVDVSLSLNISPTTVSLSGKSGIYAPSKWAPKPPTLWITGTNSEEFHGTISTYTSIPEGAYLFVRR